MVTTTIDGPETIRIENEEKLGERDALTILFVDAMALPTPAETVGMSRDPAFRRLHLDTITGIVEKRKGVVVKTIGNSVMAEFRDPIGAVRTGIEIKRLQQKFSRTDSQEPQLDVRIGIHASGLSSSGIEGFGDLVNVALAITKRATTSQILVSHSVYEEISQECDLHCQWLGKATIQGRAEQEDVFEVSWVEAPADIPARYQVLSQIGAGGMGMVYKVRDSDTTEIVALKVLKPGIASDPSMQENLRREVCLARKVTHKNVCRIYEFNRSAGAACVSMEFIEGESLSSRLRRGGPVPVQQAIELARQICAGLREAHLQGIVHRDLKPGNIIVDLTGSAKIMDFGIARLVQDNCQMTGTIAGTPAYMAPEQVELKDLDARTDIYALGLVFYEMIVGAPAFDGENPIAIAVKQIRDFPTRPREITPDVSAETEAIILKCLAKDPAKRFQSVDELDSALKKEEGPEAKSADDWTASMVREIRLGVGQTWQLLTRCMEQTRPTLSRWEWRLRQGGQQVLGVTRECAQNTKAFIRERDWSVMTSTRSQQALAGLGLVILVGGAIAFALGHSGKTHSTDVTSRPVNPGSTQSHTLALSDGVTAELSALATQESDLNRSLDAPALPANEGPLSLPTPRNSAPTKASRTLNAILRQPRPAVPEARPRPATSDANYDRPSWNGAPEIAETDPAPIESLLNPTGRTNGSQLTGPASSLSFLDVGAFQDMTWADNAVQKLSQLGFHAVSIRKGHLWGQSYHVEVGPYANAKELADAQKLLAVRGFKSHIVK